MDVFADWSSMMSMAHPLPCKLRSWQPPSRHLPPEDPASTAPSPQSYSPPSITLPSQLGQVSRWGLNPCKQSFHVSTICAHHLAVVGSQRSRRASASPQDARHVPSIRPLAKGPGLKSFSYWSAMLAGSEPTPNADELVCSCDIKYRKGATAAA